MNSGNFFAELKRRNVYKVAVAYIVAGWALSQGIAQVFPVFDVPNWVVRLIVFLIVIGFPISLIFAWAFEITPEGVKRAEEADAMPQSARPTNRTWIYIVVVGAAISLALFFLGRYTAGTRTTSSGDRKSIAVLPFASLSGDKNDAYFADGVQDQILTNLAKVSDLKVISHTSVRQYKTGAERNMREIGQQLGVAYIVEGSVQRARDRLRINAQLIDARTDSHVWAETYDRVPRPICSQFRVSWPNRSSLNSRPSFRRGRRRKSKSARLRTWTRSSFTFKRRRSSIAILMRSTCGRRCSRR